MKSNKAKPAEIKSPSDPSLKKLCASLHRLAFDLEIPSEGCLYPWPQTQLELCAQYGVFKWFLEERYGGFGWNEEELALGYLELSSVCQTTSFIITQLTGACRRIAHSLNDCVRDELLPSLLNGSHVSTVGVSHLTTSKQHLSQPVLRAMEIEKGFLLDGFSP